VKVSEAVKRGRELGLVIFQARALGWEDDPKEHYIVNGELMTGQALVDLVVRIHNGEEVEI